MSSEPEAGLPIPELDEGQEQQHSDIEAQVYQPSLPYYKSKSNAYLRARLLVLISHWTGAIHQSQFQMSRQMPVRRLPHLLQCWVTRGSGPIMRLKTTAFSLPRRRGRPCDSIQARMTIGAGRQIEVWRKAREVQRIGAKAPTLLLPWPCQSDQVHIRRLMRVHVPERLRSARLRPPCLKSTDHERALQQYNTNNLGSNLSTEK